MRPLTRGRIAAIDGAFEVADLESVQGQNTLNGQPSSAVNVRDTGFLESGHEYAAGEIARRYEDRVEHPRIDSDGDIELHYQDEVVAEYSAWAIVPGKFAIAWADWAFEHLMYNTPIWEYRDQTLLLNDFFDEESFNDVTSIGFKHRSDRADKGTVHGKHVTDDTGLGEDLTANAYLNELRYSHRYEGWVEEAKAYTAASGYVELYSPDDLTTAHYLNYVFEKIYPHTEDAEDFEGGDDE